MKLGHRAAIVLLAVLAAMGGVSLAIGEANPSNVVTGRAAFVASNEVTPGVFRKITAADLPKPFDTDSASTQSKIVPRPPGSLPTAPAGFHVGLFADGLNEPRVMRLAPNGDIFVVETQSGQVRVFRGMTADGKPKENAVFATGLHEPYGMIFYPAGKNPQWLYVANTDSVVRYAYKSGDLKTTGNAETVIAALPSSRPQDEVAWKAYDAAIAQGKAPPNHGHWDARSGILAGWQATFCRRRFCIESGRPGRSYDRGSPRRYSRIHAGRQVRQDLCVGNP